MVQLDHLSHSSVNGWLMCPRSWKFGRLDMVPHKTATNLVFGSAFHDTVEDWTRSRFLEIHKSRILSVYWEHSWKAQLERNAEQGIDWGDSSEVEMDSLGRRMLSTPEIRNVIESLIPMLTVSDTNWNRAPMGAKRPKPAIERLVELTVPDLEIPIIGYVDIVTSDGIPGDLKTAARRWSQDKADKEMQPTLYLAALEQMGFKHNPDREFRYYIFTKAKKAAAQVLTTYRTQEQIDWAFQAVRDVYDAIKKGVFPPNATTWKCAPKWCEFYDHCHN